MMKTLQDKMVLSNGQHIPYIGLGVFQMSEQNYITQAVMQAIQTGYRLFDTAAVYNNEKKSRFCHKRMSCGASGTFY